MRNAWLAFVSALICSIGLAAQKPGTAPAPRLSPAAEASTTMAGKTVTIKYSAPSVRGRQIFGPGGLVSKDQTYPVWRGGANDATALHTDAALQVGNLQVPAGDYTLFVLVQDPNAWQLIVNKQTGQWGLTYDPKQDLGRIPMKMSVPPAPIELLRYNFLPHGADKCTLQLEWEKHIASAAVSLAH